MTCDDSAFESSAADDFQRWYFGGSPPESDAWERHAFEAALLGAPLSAAREPMPAAVADAPDFGCEGRTPVVAV